MHQPRYYSNRWGASPRSNTMSQQVERHSPPLHRFVGSCYGVLAVTVMSCPRTQRTSGLAKCRVFLWLLDLPVDRFSIRKRTQKTRSKCRKTKVENETGRRKLVRCTHLGITPVRGGGMASRKLPVLLWRSFGVRCFATHLTMITARSLVSDAQFACELIAPAVSVWVS